MNRGYIKLFRKIEDNILTFDINAQVQRCFQLHGLLRLFLVDLLLAG